MATLRMAIPAAVTEEESAQLLRRMREVQQALGDRALIPVCGRPSSYRWTSGFKVLAARRSRAGGISRAPSRLS